MVYELFLYHLIEDFKELHDIYLSCKSGEKMCGDCKKYAAQIIEKLLTDIHQKRKTSHDKIKDYLF